MKEKPDHMNPLLFKTGIPFALSFGGWFFFSAIIRRTTRNRMPPETTMPENQTNTPQIAIHLDESCSDSIDSTSLACEEEEYPLTLTQISDSFETLQFKQIDYRPELEQEIISLKNQVSALEQRQGELKEHFLHYRRSQEQESALKELRNALEFEITHVDFLGLKLEIMEAENRRLESVLSEYPRVIEELGLAKSQMQLMQRKIKKLVRMKREGLSAFRLQAFVLQERKAEIASKDEELKQRKREIEELKAAVMELQRIADQLQMENNEMIERLELTENLDSSIPQMTAEDYPSQQGLDCEELLNQIEQLQNERATNIDELIYLRWINACLRYELLRNQEQECLEENDQGKELVLELPTNSEVENCEMEYGWENQEEQCKNEEKGKRSVSEFSRNEVVKNCEMGYGWDNQEQQCENEEKGKQSVSELTGNELVKNCEMGYVSDDHLIGTKHGHGGPSSVDVEAAAKSAAQTKPMLFGKLKRWAKGKERRRRSCDGKENQDKCSGRCSVSELEIEDFTARNSCSSVKPCFGGA